jgi:hypothetical protein
MMYATPNHNAARASIVALPVCQHMLTETELLVLAADHAKHLHDMQTKAAVVAALTMDIVK